MADTNIKTQISRLSGAKSDLATAITAKGVTVPDDTTLDGYAALVEQIDTGVDTSDADATASDIAKGKNAYVNGSKVTGTIDSPVDVAAESADCLSISSGNIVYTSSGSGTDKVIWDKSKNNVVRINSSYFGSCFQDQVLEGRTFTADGRWKNATTHVSGGAVLLKAEGTMTNNGAWTSTIAPGASVTIPAGYHNGSGKVTASGSSSGVDTSDATATAANILSGKTAYVDGAKLTGTMTNNGAISKTLAANGTYTIPAGYHNGSGKVTQSLTTKAATTYTPGTSNQTIASGTYLTGAQTIKGDSNLVAANIASGVSIFGVKGTYTGSSSGVDTSDATATAASILSGKTAYVNGSKITGTMTNNGAVAKTMTANGSYTIPAGYHNGSGKVTVNVSSSSGSSNNNVEAYAVTTINPSVSFKRTDGAIKIWGYGTMTSSGGWGQQTTSLVAFEGDKYHKGAIYGSPSSTSLSLSISNGKLTGLPSGLTAINAIVTRGI